MSVTDTPFPLDPAAPSSTPPVTTVADAGDLITIPRALVEEAIRGCAPDGDAWTILTSALGGSNRPPQPEGAHGSD